MKTIPLAFFLLLAGGYSGLAQDSSSSQLPNNYLSSVTEKLCQLKTKIDHETQRNLKKLQQQELRIQKKLSRLKGTGTSAATTVTQQFEALQKKMQEPIVPTTYIPVLDTLKTSLRFLARNQQFLEKEKEMTGRVSKALFESENLEQSLAKAKLLKELLQERRNQMKQILSGLPFSWEIKKLNKQAYYYAAQLNEYKSILQDPGRIEKKAISMLMKTAAFQDFMRRNGQLASLFRMEEDIEVGSSITMQGLQTRALISQSVQNQIGNSQSAESLFSQHMSSAQSQLSALKAKAAAYSAGSIGSSQELEQPDFRPNTQKTKSFLNRMVYGGNIQTQKAKNFFPATTDIGLMAGYRLNDKSIAGIGASYKLGLGKNWSQMTFSHQGIGLRSFIDFQIKGGFYLSGGYEQNYRTVFQSMDQLENLTAWHQSGLIGVSRKYSISKKLKGNAQLLWDFLSYRQVPQTQAVLFRVGYQIK